MDLLELPPSRLVWAALAVAAWLLLSWSCFRRTGLRPASRSAIDSQWLIAYASQSGAARAIAERLAGACGERQLPSTLMPLNSVTPAMLAGHSRALFVVSTYGEGEAPDNGAGFLQRAGSQLPDLSHLHYALLALGDRNYADFCGFGRRLERWLDQAGATTALESGMVDRMEPTTLEHWYRRVAAWTGWPLESTPAGAATTQWTFLDRVQLNPGSPGDAAWLIRLAPAGALPVWEAGDLARVQIGAIQRTYSIASLPEDGVLELIVRQVTDAAGRLGQGSGWLCRHAEPGNVVDIQLQSNPAFHLPDTTAPSILIGAGTGLAGLRGLLKRRQHLARQDNWLIFGERCQVHDAWLADELDACIARGQLVLDRCFSRAGEQSAYVQHRLREKSDELRLWVDRGASIHVCGRLAGVGRETHRVLQEVLSPEQWQALEKQQRYRRDLY